MIVISLKDNELHLCPDGQIATLSGRESYAQTVSNAIRTVFGEIPSNTSLGIPYFDSVFKDGRRGIALWKAKVTERLRSFDFVLSVSGFKASVDSGDVLKYSLVITTDLGNVSVSGEIDFKLYN